MRGEEAPRLRLAMVSTFDELCGIASYTRALVPLLQASMEVEVLDLDQGLLLNTHPRISALGDRHIREIAARLREADAVNIQLEFGTLGLTPPQILRRLGWMMEAARALTLTLHRVPEPAGTPWGAILAGGAPGAFGRFVAAVHEARLARGLHRLMRQAERRRPFGLIVHGAREARLLRDLHGYRTVEHHPLAFLPEDAARALRQSASRADFPQLAALPPDAVLVGIFGFLSPYKGIETAIEALRLLPETHHLLLFGNVHSQRYRPHQPIDPYLKRLVEACEGGMFRRVHFMGSPGDAAFARAMAVCDVVAMPYLEVGQTSSGAIAIALELGCRVVASRTRNFLQLDRAMPGRMALFDVGNPVELAQRILAPGPRPADGAGLPFGTATNTALYCTLHRRLAAGASAQPRVA
jgi:glycosyltransferase involved in cell wall biosynthesis